MPIDYGKNPKRLVINAKPILVHEDALVFQAGNRPLGKVKATYDFSELPSHLHEMAYKILEKSQVVYYTL